MRGFGPRNAVSFIWFGAEESGLLGSKHYVATLSDAERERIAAMLNFDMIGSTNFVRFVYDGDNSTGEGAVGPEGSDDIEAMFLEYFASQGLPTEPTAFDGRSDYGPFIAAGVPAGGLVHRRRGDQDGRAGCDLRRHRRRAVRPVLPRGLRHPHEPE
jgi:Zn-dependent M28 family amino/carboxypeptidase